MDGHGVNDQQINSRPTATGRCDIGAKDSGCPGKCDHSNLKYKFISEFLCSRCSFVTGLPHPPPAACWTPRPANTWKARKFSVTGTTLHTTSARGGISHFNGVAVGEQQLPPPIPPRLLNTAVTVAADGPTTVEVKFNSEVLKLEAFHVAGMKEGSAQATALQKAAVNMKVVAAGDQYGDIAEGNAAEYLKFLPGVGIDYNANDARAVSLRGMNTQFTAVTMNGSPVASATSGNLNRRFEFEQLSISNVETIEVIKTLTPDLPATGTAGLINMVTKSAFDRAGDLFTYRLYLQGLSTEFTTAKTPGWGQSRRARSRPHRPELRQASHEEPRHQHQLQAFRAGERPSPLFLYLISCNPPTARRPTPP